MVDFTLSPSELAVRSAAQTFAGAHLTGARATYNKIVSHAERFQSTQPIYSEAVKAGLIKGQIPVPLGGTNSSLLEAAILVEELTVVERAASLTIFGTGLGLTPLCLAFQEGKREFLEPFLSGEGSPLASLVFSEPGGVVSLILMGMRKREGRLADQYCRRIGLRMEQPGCRLRHSWTVILGC